MIPALFAALSLFAGTASAGKENGELKQIQVAQNEKGEHKMKQQYEKKEKKEKKKKKDKKDKDKDKGRDKDKSRDKDRDRDRDKDRDKRLGDDDDRTYGNQLMTEQERIEHRDRMRAATSDAERDQIRREHHELMKERGRARGITLPDEPPATGGGMGPGRNRNR